MRTVRVFTVASFILMLAACEAVKSSNPLSPSVAGPIAGVAISEPKLLEPGSGWTLDNGSQPVRLLIENAATTGQRPLAYTFEVASDAQFNMIVFSRGGVTPGEGGRTSIQLSDRLPTGQPFYWRARAEDGANTSTYSAVVSFTILTPVVIDVPRLVDPVGGAKVGSNRPTFRIANPARSGPVGAIVYQLHVAANEAFAPELALYQISEQSNDTRLDAPLTLPYDQTFFWRVRAFDSGPSGVSTPWSGAQAFRTPTAPPAPTPSPSPGPGPSPVPDGGGNAPCSGNTGPEVVACVSSTYAQYRVGGISLGQRIANMQFLRDRIIETGKCKGLDLGLNLKRGGPEISNDFVVWKDSNGVPHGIDIAHAYDDPGPTLQLQWMDYGPNGGSPFYKDYGSVSCR